MKIEIHDPRPESTEELARQTAIELRKRGIRAEAHTLLVSTCQWIYNVCLSVFDNLGPIACADVIQAGEARRAQEWAGDPADITDPQKPTKPALCACKRPADRHIQTVKGDGWLDCDGVVRLYR